MFFDIFVFTGNNYDNNNEYYLTIYHNIEYKYLFKDNVYIWFYYIFYIISQISLDKILTYCCFGVLDVEKEKIQ